MINKLTIRPEDLNKLRGKFIMQVNDDDHEPFKTQSKGFLLEKRISFISLIDGGGDDDKWLLSGFYYSHGKPLSEENFIAKINAENKGRHYRLLTPKELAILFEWMNEELLDL